MLSVVFECANFVLAITSGSCNGIFVKGTGYSSISLLGVAVFERISSRDVCVESVLLRDVSVLLELDVDDIEAGVPDAVVDVLVVVGVVDEAPNVGI